MNFRKIRRSLQKIYFSWRKQNKTEDRKLKKIDKYIKQKQKETNINKEKII